MKASAHKASICQSDRGSGCRRYHQRFQLLRDGLLDGRRLQSESGL